MLEREVWGGALPSSSDASSTVAAYLPFGGALYDFL